MPDEALDSKRQPGDIASGQAKGDIAVGYAGSPTPNLESEGVVDESSWKGSIVCRNAIGGFKSAERGPLAHRSGVAKPAPLTAPVDVDRSEDIEVRDRCGGLVRSRWLQG